MASGTDSDVLEELARENEALRAQVAELERQLAEQAERTNAIVASAQERVYWLDRWHIDMDSLVAIPGVSALRGLFRLIRAPFRLARKLARSLSE